MDTGSGDFSGLAQLQLPGINSQNDGLLFTVANDEGDTLRGNYANNAALADGSGWFVAVRGIEESSSDPTAYASSHSSFSFLYIPFTAANLIGAHIKGSDGSTIKAAGTFTMSRLSGGRYALTIPGKTGTNGMLLLQNSGYLANPPSGKNNVVDTSFLSYEYGGTNSPATAFIIEARHIDSSAGAVLRDADFNFVWVDFTNPLAPAGGTVSSPSLSIARQGTDKIVISWTDAPGFTLQSTTALSQTPSWQELGAQNPQTISITGNSQFFRLIHQ